MPELHFCEQLQLGGNGRLLPAIWHLNLVALRWLLPGTLQHYSFYCIFIYVQYKGTHTTQDIHKDWLIKQQPSAQA